MAKITLNGQRASNVDLFLIQPEALKIITDKAHALYDPRAELPLSESLVQNLIHHGENIQPIVVVKDGKEDNGDDILVVINGRQRTRAMCEANRRLQEQGLPPMKIKAVLKNGSESDLYAMILSENEIRQNDDPIVLAEKIRKIHTMGASVTDIAVFTGKTRQWVIDQLTTANMSDTLKEAVQQGEVKATAAVQLAKSDLSREEQGEVLKELRDSGEKITVDKVKSAVSSKVGGERSSSKVPAKRMRSRKEIEDELERLKSITPQEESGTWYSRIQVLKWVLYED